MIIYVRHAICAANGYVTAATGYSCGSATSCFSECEYLANFAFRLFFLMTLAEVVSPSCASCIISQGICTINRCRVSPLQFVIILQLQTKMHEAQTSGGAAMTPQEIQEFFARQHQTPQPKDNQSSQQYMRDDSGTSGNRSGSQPSLHQRHL